MAIAKVFVSILWHFYGKNNRFYCNFEAKAIDFIAVSWQFQGEKKIKLDFYGIMQYNLHENSLYFFYYNIKCYLKWLHIIDCSDNLFINITYFYSRNFGAGSLFYQESAHLS